MNQASRRIAHALHKEGWSFEEGLRASLMRNATRIKPDEYDVDMKGSLFCPVCFTNLNRVPHDKDHTTSNKDAHFRHMSKYKRVPCVLRSTKKVQIKKYNSLESVNQAIDNEELVIVSAFMKDKPVPCLPKDPQPFAVPQFDDIDGPETEVPLGVHNGQSFKVPSKISSLRGICRNFDKNYYRYFFFPGYRKAIALNSLIRDARNIKKEERKPKLYVVKLQNSSHFGHPPRDNNIRMTYIESSQEVKDF
ncbi:hypothetical protein C1141_19175, partial [Vibrio agarivorans]